MNKSRINTYLMKSKGALFLQLITMGALCFSLKAIAQHESMATNMQTEVQNVSSEQAVEELSAIGKKILVSPINKLPVQQNGRIKPLDTLARESLLFIAGSNKKFSLEPVQTYLALTAYVNAPFVEIIEVRDITLRTELGFLKNKKFFSLRELSNTTLSQLAEPLFNKQSENSRSLSEHEKNILETYHQMSILDEIISGQAITVAADYSFLKNNHGTTEEMNSNKELQGALKNYFQALADTPEMQIEKSKLLLNISAQQEVPKIFEHYLKKIDTEIFYNQFRAFFWASLLAIFLGVAFFSPLFRNKVSKTMTVALYTLPVAFIVLGLGLRVYITQFAPITNMYGTMIWVAFGVNIFGLILFYLYKNYTIPGMTLLSSGLILLLTEQMPLILSPDLDPIVAVLRSNFWLSTHVTTITISYAAFTIAMVLGNIGLIRLILFQDNKKYFAEYSHYAYRMIQLGCFLLSVGIILGGVWADYSWGRFWGWDPKETWALIADLGFLMILHGKYIGWISPMTLLALSPLAYLLVIMAWYGVNFILAAGLHSYGFSSGGATAIGLFVLFQLVLLAVGLLRYQTLKPRLHE